MSAAIDTAEAPVTNPPERSRSRTMGLPIYRLNMMRAGYLLMGMGLALVKWPLLFGPAPSLPVFEGVVAALLTAMSLLAFLGLKHPVAMLPILLFECAWKPIWIAAVVLPHLVAHDLDAATTSVLISCSLDVLIIAVTPWRFAWRRYVVAAGDKWRR